MRRRSIVLALALLASACGAGPERFPQKLVIIGFEGLDPSLVSRWMRAGRLPNLAKLAGQGGFVPLETTPSVESPSAWSSFATGVNPGRHQVFDALVRDPATYAPRFSMVTVEPPRLLFGSIPTSGPRFTSVRGGTSFWVTAGQAGVRSSVLTVPMTFPPERVPNGELLAGLPTPDLRGTVGTYQYFGTDVAPGEEGATEFGGLARRLTFQRNVAHTVLAGPPDLAPSEGDPPSLDQPFTVTWNHEARTANIDIAGVTVHLAERQWSRWVAVDFRPATFVRLHGLVQFYLIAAGTSLKLYVSPINWDPSRPPAPLSSPPSLSKDIFDRVGPFRTLGWPEATWPLVEGRIDEQAFLEDLDRAFNDRAAAIMSRLDAARWDLLVGVIEAPDRVQHMMWQYIDPEHPLYDAGQAGRWGSAIERVYLKADAFIGQVLERLPPGADLMVVSDHGFHSFRYAVNLNTWLTTRGYMTRRGASATHTMAELYSGTGLWEGVDWSATRAYAMGLGQIYVNLQGREGRGIVAAGADYDALVASLVADLKGWIDPRTGRGIVREVYRRGELYSGPFVDEAADLQLGFEDGYRVSWQTALGAAPPELIEPNLRHWSGDHAGYDYRATPGLLISTRKPSDAARLIDIAPTVLKYFGLEIPQGLDGKPLF